MRLPILLTALMTVALPTSATLAKDTALASAVKGQNRTEAFVERDKVRHPQEVLEFIGVKPNQTVVEIYPGGGYWTEILAPYLHEKGTYYTAVSPSGMAKWKDKLAADPKQYGNVKVTELSPTGEIAPAGTVDAVVTFRNVHNWMRAGAADQVFASFYKALKPGGVLGVEEHRAPADKPQDPKAENGYVREDYTIALAEKAGFKLAGRSELLANPKDTKDYPKGVWTLPPTYALGDQDRAKYEAIGEADNFLLKFVKPE
jgi:predicted methyltransferase